MSIRSVDSSVKIDLGLTSKSQNISAKIGKIDKQNPGLSGSLKLTPSDNDTTKGLRTAHQGKLGIYLHVIEYNTLGQRFYEKLGFVYLGTIPHFYYLENRTWSAICYMYFFDPVLAERMRAWSWSLESDVRE